MMGLYVYAIGLSEKVQGQPRVFAEPKRMRVLEPYSENHPHKAVAGRSRVYNEKEDIHYHGDHFIYQNKNNQ